MNRIIHKVAVLGSGVMIFGGVICGVFGISAAGKSLEDVTDPLSLVAPAEDGVTPEGAS